MTNDKVVFPFFQFPIKKKRKKSFLTWSLFSSILYIHSQLHPLQIFSHLTSFHTLINFLKNIVWWTTSPININYALNFFGLEIISVHEWSSVLWSNLDTYCSCKLETNSSLIALLLQGTFMAETTLLLGMNCYLVVGLVFQRFNQWVWVICVVQCKFSIWILADHTVKKLI